MNKLILMGRLTKDPELKYTPGGKALCVFGFAADRRFKQEGGPTADFFRCQAWGPRAEAIAKYLVKGTKVLLEGRVENNNFTNKDGAEIRTFVVQVENFSFCEGKKSNSTEEAAAEMGDDAQMFNQTSVNDDDLPF